MALIFGDRVLETSTSTGTGAFTLAAAITGYQRFSAVCSVSDTVHYSIFAVDANGNPSGDWETGLGTYSSANTLTRTTVEDSSNSGSAVDFGAGTKYVMLTVTGARMALLTHPTWDFNFTDDADAYIRAPVAMTVAEQDTTGTGTIAYEKSTSAAPDTFSSTTAPITLEAGAKLKVSASSITGSVAVHLERTA